MNMFKPSDSTSIAEYLAAIPEGRKPTIDFLHIFIQEVAPDLHPHWATNMLGYGQLKYFDKRAKEVKPWPIVALANQKSYISLYVCAVEADQYLPELFGERLGKVNVGRSCIRFKRLEDLDLESLRELLVRAQSSPGMVGAEIVKE